MPAVASGNPDALDDPPPKVAIMGGLTDQCVDSAVRDACDAGFLVTVVTDACITYTEERHQASLSLNRGYCRRRTSHELVDEIAALAADAGAVRAAAAAARTAAIRETAALWEAVSQLTCRGGA